ncbi:DUF1800 family protein [Nereida sp. MMG025]|uniref:DUF1800 domain-containing protein n=1 Tax=Nereida sp. MMG025 TaxID=2909981 RepID=UPI001F2BDE58|nr:DUF1800 domain-containing protein [Nereida sp. MMG025]MCF6444060.1 DUF1800 domain-containing protein [Nereida sp. MMG025]
MFNPQFAERRFGTGLGPDARLPQSVGDMLAQAQGRDEMAVRYPIRTLEARWSQLYELSQLRKRRRRLRGTDAGEEASKAFSKARRTMRNEAVRDLTHTVLRGARAPSGFRERLVQFWADHFTAAPPQAEFRFMRDSYVESAIRPHVTARFGDMLKAVITNPAMLAYLDQHLSAGPSTKVGKRRGRGLNENLAREVLELHTLGVGGAYDQDDVRQLAELFTGLGFRDRDGFHFKDGWAEPGAEEVLGVRYGNAGRATIEPILAALDDLARHPDTARHLARKLAVHFVADAPSDALIAAMEAAYLDTQGDLSAVYDAMLSHPAAWQRTAANIKQPVEFVWSSLRALGVQDDDLTTLTTGRTQVYLVSPLTVMGQQWRSPLGPDGWPEEDEVWITPQGMAARITWAMNAPAGILSDLPDPRDFVQTALGQQVPADLSFAVGAAEDVASGIGLTLISPAFQRR